MNDKINKYPIHDSHLESLEYDVINKSLNIVIILKILINFIN